MGCGLDLREDVKVFDEERELGEGCYVCGGAGKVEVEGERGG